MTIWQYRNTSAKQYDNTTQKSNLTVQQCHNTTTQQHDNTIQLNNMTIWKNHNTTIQQYDNTTCVIILIWQHDNITIQQHMNMTIQYDRTIWQYDNIQNVHTFICIKTFVIRLENLHKVVRIDNIWSPSDHGMNHICKLVIESETLVVFAQWTQKEFRQMSTTSNYLEDGIWIADNVRALESSISMALTISIMYVALSGLRKISIIWRPLFIRCLFLRMISTLNMFKQTGIPFLLIPNLPPSSPPCLGCEGVILLRSSISWHCIILVYLLQIAFVIFTTAE